MLFNKKKVRGKKRRYNEKCKLNQILIHLTREFNIHYPLQRLFCYCCCFFFLVAKYLHLKARKCCIILVRTKNFQNQYIGICYKEIKLLYFENSRSSSGIIDFLKDFIKTC